jgi:hypothetical protein
MAATIDTMKDAAPANRDVEAILEELNRLTGYLLSGAAERLIEIDEPSWRILRAALDPLRTQAGSMSLDELLESNRRGRLGITPARAATGEQMMINISEWDRCRNSAAPTLRPEGDDALIVDAG